VASTAIVRSEVLYRVPRALLVRILGPFEAFFAARAVSLAELAATAQDDRTLVRAALDALHADVSAVPAPCRAQLSALNALATASGQTTLFALCPDLTKTRVGPEEAAAVAMLDYPEQFARAMKAAEDATLTFSDYDASSKRAPNITDETYPALRALLVEWMVAHGRGALLNLHASERGHELHLEIENGRIPVTDDLVGESLDLTQVTLVRAERAYVILDRARGRLSVHASHPAIKELLRRVIGDQFYGNPQHFRRAGVYSLDPLAQGLDAALAYDDVPGLEEVVLVGIKILTGKHRETHESLGGEDLRRGPRASAVVEALAGGGTPTWLKVRFKVHGTTRLLALTVGQKTLASVPDEVERVLDEWLTARGYIVTREHVRVIEAEVAPPSELAPTSHHGS